MKTPGLQSLLLTLMTAGALASPSLRADEVRIGRACPSGEFHEQVLVEVTAESRPGKTYTLIAMADTQGDLQHLKYEGSRVGTVCFTLTDLRANAVIMNENGRDIIRIKAERDFTSKDGGAVTLSYLSDGVVGRYSRFPVRLTRLGHWQLEHEGRAFDQLHFENNYGVFGMLIGVERPVPRYVR